MREKIKIQKGFIQIPLLIIVIASIVVALAGTGVVLYKQGKLSSITASVSQIFKEAEEIVTTEKDGTKSEEESNGEISQSGIESKFQEIETVERIVPKKLSEEAVGEKPQPEEVLKEPREEKEVEEEIGIVVEEKGEIEEKARDVFERNKIGVSKVTVTPEMGTEVKGIISENTVWATQNSPYIITNDVLLEKGVTLRIEPGVIVKFQEGKGRGNKGGFEIINKGNIIAKGSPNNKIIFTSLEPDPRLGDWGAIEVIDGGSINFDYTEIKYASTGVTVENASEIIIANSHFYDCGTGIFVNKGPAIISNNLIENNYAGISFLHIPYSGPFDDGTFHYQGLRETKITYNTIRNNIGQSSNEYHTAIHIELNAFLYSLIISYNDIYNNSGGIFVRETGGFNTSIYKLPTIEQNNIYNNKFHYNNKDYTVFVNGESEIEIDMSNNWWGTTDTKAIDSLIYDYYESFRPGTINYQPIATSEIPSAGVQ